MAKPITPTAPGWDLPVTIYAKDQPQYRQLPCYRSEEGDVLIRWRLTWWERILAVFRGDVYLWVSTFGSSLQPLLLQVRRPQMDAAERTARAIDKDIRKAMQ